MESLDIQYRLRLGADRVETFVIRLDPTTLDVHDPTPPSSSRWPASTSPSPTARTRWRARSGRGSSRSTSVTSTGRRQRSTAGRLRAATKADASLNAVVLLDTYAQLVPDLVESALEELRGPYETFLRQLDAAEGQPPARFTR